MVSWRHPRSSHMHQLEWVITRSAPNSVLFTRKLPQCTQAFDTSMRRLTSIWRRRRNFKKFIFLRRKSVEKSTSKFDKHTLYGSSSESLPILGGVKQGCVFCHQHFLGSSSHSCCFMPYKFKSSDKAVYLYQIRRQAFQLHSRQWPRYAKS